MKNIFKHWLHKDAEWYHFWLPQSGVTGGLILGTVVTILIAIVVLT